MRYFKINLDLSFHGEAEECDKVHHKNGPEYRDVEDLKESTHQSNESRFAD